MTASSRLGITIVREMEASSCLLKEVFKGVERVDAVRSIFGDDTEVVLDKVKLVRRAGQGYLYVDDSNGSVVISAPYLKSGDERYLYLDVIHELVHVRQFMEGKELFDGRFSYVDRPTEKEAYSVATEEARRIGMSDEEIREYLKVEWVSAEELRRLFSSVGLP